jgi:hypothetical protein
MNIKKYTIGILEILVMQLQLPAPEKKVRLQVTRKGELCHFDPSGIGIPGKSNHRLQDYSPAGLQVHPYLNHSDLIHLLD